MRKRLLLSVVFGLLGLVLSLPLGDRIGLGMVPAFLTCTIGGAFVGYMLSIVLDVFLEGGSADHSETEEAN